LLIDGGWVDKIPVLPAFRLGADIVIAVDISADLQGAKRNMRGIDVVLRANEIKDSAMTELQRRLADIVIEPGVRRIHWADFESVDFCIEAGDAAASGAVPKIRELTPADYADMCDIADTHSSPASAYQNRFDAPEFQNFPTICKDYIWSIFQHSQSNFFGYFTDEGKLVAFTLRSYSRTTSLSPRTKTGRGNTSSKTVMGRRSASTERGSRSASQRRTG
jgi:predicted RNA methylase